MRKLLAVVGLAFLVVLMDSPPSAADPVLFLDQSFETVEGVRAFYLSESPLWAQTFTVGITGTLDHAEAYVEKVAYTTDPLLYAIASYSDGTIGSLLMTGSIDTSTIFPSFAWLHLNTNNLAVSEGDQLALVLWANEAIAPYVWKGSTFGGYQGGELLKGDLGSFQTTGYDANFRTFVSESVPEPSALALFGVGSFLGAAFRRRRRPSA